MIWLKMERTTSLEQGLIRVQPLAQRKRFLWYRGCVGGLFRGLFRGCQGVLRGIQGVWMRLRLS